MLMKLARRISQRATRRQFRRLVSDAYHHPNLTSHSRIRKAAGHWYGTMRGTAFDRRWSELFIELVYHAQLALFRDGLDRDLGASPIGFEDLMLNCRSSDANSSVVYLFGFSDNLTFFALYRKFIQAGSVAIDVGANLGMHSLVLSRCVGERGSVIAYEPSDSIHDRLLQNIGRNDASNIVSRKLGLWDRPGRASFESREGEFNIGKGAIHDGAPVQVPVTTLDEEASSLKGRVGLIKIDVEGAELSVIKGARGMLSEHRPTLIMEFNPEQYSLADLVDQIPYDCRCYRVPYTLWESVTPIEGVSFGQRADILIIPSDRALSATGPLATT